MCTIPKDSTLLNSLLFPQGKLLLLLLVKKKSVHSWNILAVMLYYDKTHGPLSLVLARPDLKIETNIEDQPLLVSSVQEVELDVSRAGCSGASGGTFHQYQRAAASC